MLRTLFVLLILAFGLRHAVRGPFYATLLYLFVAYFRPELWVWGGLFGYLPLSFYIGVFALAWGALSGQLRWDARVGLVVVFVLHSLLSTSLSEYQDWSWPFWVDFAKSSAITWLVASLVTDVNRFRQVLLVMSLSLGFEGAKQGWVMFFVYPGSKNFNDIPNLGDNNSAAVGMLVLTCLFVALARTAKPRAERLAHRLLAVGVLYRGITTYSRGGFIAATVVGLMYFFRSKRKLGAAIGLATVALVIVPVLPSEFWERMITITASVTDQETTISETNGELANASAVSRLYFWRVALRMAADHPILGVGHNAYTQAYDDYDTSEGEFGTKRSVHSSWFSVLAELGYVGLGLFVVTILLALLACRRARRLAPSAPAQATLREFGIALETGLVAIVVGGSFVIAQYTELLWHMIGLTIALNRLSAEASAAVPAPQPSLPGRPTGQSVAAVWPMRDSDTRPRRALIG